MYWKKCFRKLKSFALKKKTPKNCKKGKKWWCFWRKKGWPCSWLKMRIWHKTWRVASSALKQYAWKNMFLKVGRKHVVFLTKLDFCTKFIEFHGIFKKKICLVWGWKKMLFQTSMLFFFFISNNAHNKLILRRQCMWLSSVKLLSLIRLGYWCCHIQFSVTHCEKTKILLSFENISSEINFTE